MRSVPTLTPHAIPPGSLARVAQPVLDADIGLLLRPWTPTDACALTRLYADPDIRRWHMFAIDTQGEALEVIERWRQRWLAETGAHWAVTARPDWELAGRIGLRAMDTRQGIAEAIYSTAPAFRGQGVAPASLELLTTWAFSAGFHRLFLRHSAANPASCRVAAKSGFTAEGTERGSELHTDGWHDMHVHARIATGKPPMSTGKAA
jgi:RimJ/RimL family protein N-acetyltransferase